MSGLNFSRLCVLTIDDDEFVRGLIQKMLARFGCREIHEAGDGRQGLRAVKRLKPDVVLCDINMEPMNGFLFLKTLRNDPAIHDNKLPVIFLTMLSDGNAVTKARMLDVDAYLIKPVSPQMLKEKIEHVMAGRQPLDPAVRAGYAPAAAAEAAEEPVGGEGEEEIGPAAAGLPLSRLLEILQGYGYTDLHDAVRRFDCWLVEATNKSGQRVKLTVDMHTGGILLERGT